MVEWYGQGKTEVLGKNLSHCHVMHPKSEVEWPGIDPDLWTKRPLNNRLSYGTIHLITREMIVLIIFGTKYEI